MLPRRSAAAMVGRQAHLAACIEALNRARSGHLEVVLIAGEAGVGKTRLVREFSAVASTQPGVSVIQAACFGTAWATPYAPIREALSRLPDDAGAVGLLSADSELSRTALFDAVADRLRPGVGEAARLLVLEDLHWLDRASMELLTQLILSESAVPLIIAGTFRENEVVPGEPLSELLVELTRRRLAVEINLSTLDEDQVGKMLALLTGRQLPPGFVQTMAKITGGNPFFIEELLQALRHDGRLETFIQESREQAPVNSLQIPLSVRESIVSRERQLDETDRRIARVAAVIGDRFGFDVLQGILGISETRLLDGMRTLIDAQILVEESSGDFAFRHALTRQAIYNELLQRERRHIHLEVAEKLREAGSDADALAYHFFEGQDYQSALIFSARAGHNAAAMYAPRSAVEQFSRAITAARNTMAGTAQSESIAELASLYRARGGAQDLIGDTDAARSDLEEALKLSRAAGDLEAECSTLLQLGLVWSAEDYTTAATYLQRGLELARTSEDERLFASALNRVGNWRLNIGQPAEAAVLHEEALAIVRRLDDRSGIAATLDLLAMTSYHEIRLDDMKAYGKEAVRLFRELDDRQGLASSLALLTMTTTNHDLSCMVGSRAEFDEALAGCREAIAITRSMKWIGGEAFASYMAANALGARGHYAEAVELQQHAASLARQIGHAQWSAAVLYTRGHVELDLLDLDAAERSFQDSLRLATEIATAVWIDEATAGLVTVLLARGRVEEAGALLPELESRTLTLPSWPLFEAAALLTLRRGDAAGALAAMARLEEQVGAAAECSRLALLKAEALVSLGDPATGLATLQRLADGARSAEVTSLLWRALSAQADILAHLPGKRDEAQERSDAAREVIENIASALADDAAAGRFRDAAFAQLPRLRPLTNRRQTQLRFAGLSEREREIAALITSGATNRQIADSLILSERTVAVHVGNILNKLGFASRAQIAAWAAGVEGLAP